MKIIGISEDTSVTGIFMIIFPSSNQCASQDRTHAQCTLCERYGNYFERFAGPIDSVSHLHSNIIKHGTGDAGYHGGTFSRIISRRIGISMWPTGEK